MTSGISSNPFSKAFTRALLNPMQPLAASKPSNLVANTKVNGKPAVFRVGKTLYAGAGHPAYHA
jgi:hypothetical protein